MTPDPKKPKAKKPSELYRCFSTDTDPDEAVESFVNRYGIKPAEIFEELRLLWIGPIPNQTQ